ncbi:ester cyclase [Amycolatopsis jejuensis]|uniref:ester cyclase n=1 Tax=Amycolatopsis jejuensis TaxID=330084 RepID=UPI0005275705|nr:ester cyclase [Amycolatopsis jejuensis]
MDLKTIYLGYLAALNERRFGDLDDFVHAEVTYNGEVLTRQQYAAMIDGDSQAIPDLRFDPQLLTTDGDLVACRLWFDCTPARPFFGHPPTGERISFAENVFYRFREGRIEEVWSLIDRESVARQLGQG